VVYVDGIGVVSLNDSRTLFISEYGTCESSREIGPRSIRTTIRLGYISVVGDS